MAASGKTELLLLVEGANLDAVVADTQDLSITRGGSLMLVDAIDRLRQELRSQDASASSVRCLSQGASIGVFVLSLKDGADEASFRDTVESWLAGAAVNDGGQDVLALTPYAAFLVDSIAVSRDFEADIDAVTAKNRWRRMQAPNLAYPFDDARQVAKEASGEAIEALVCGTHASAPAMPDMKVFKGKDRYVLRSVWNRRTYGVDQKKAFYRSFLGKDGMPEAYANDLDEIACLSETDKKVLGDATRTIGRLDGKIAILFADGNGFTKRRRALVKEGGQTGLEKWDSQILHLRKELLAGLLQRLDGRGHLAYRQNSPAADRLLRLETLLFAGDDTLWVLPAWLGLDAARLFFDATLNWKVETTDQAPLTHAMGLVFCHHDAPMHRLTKLAKSLAGTAKSDRKTNRLAVEVLESFDHPGTDFHAYRRTRTPATMRTEDWLLDPAGLDQAIKAAHRLIETGVPRRQLRRHAMAVASGAPTLAQTRDDLAGSFAGDAADFADAVKALERCLGPEPWLWLHLETLYDYLAATP